MKQALNPNQKQKVGKLGEDIASSYLTREKYLVIERNFKKHYGEIDIIALKDNILVFVEVKTRIGQEFGIPEEAVTSGKLREVIRTAAYYTSTHVNLPEEQRIDVIAIELDEYGTLLALRHHESVTS